MNIRHKLFLKSYTESMMTENLMNSNGLAEEALVMGNSTKLTLLKIV